MTEVMDEDKTRKITEALEYLSTDDDQYKVISKIKKFYKS